MIEFDLKAQSEQVTNLGLFIALSIAETKTRDDGGYISLAQDRSARERLSDLAHGVEHVLVAQTSACVDERRQQRPIEEDDSALEL
jgi:hypothetical protein